MPTETSVFDDPITLEIIWGRLATVAAEMQTVLRRTALSTLISAANDLACEIMDARGWSVAHAATSNPAFNLTMPHVTSALLEAFPADTLRPGDVLFTNDPWIGNGHLPDVSVVTPFFKNGKLVGFAGSIAHVSDIGGLLNQSQARTVYEEGLFFPPMKLYDEGRRNEAIIATIRKSVRLPDTVIGDISAIVTANSVAVRQVVDLLDEYGVDDLSELSDAIQDRAEQAMRRTIEALPDGDYPYEHTFNVLDSTLTIGVVIRIRGTELAVDYVKVPPQHDHGGINSTMTFTTARSIAQLNCLLTPNIPSNQGLFRPITVTAPEGSILNPTYPASVNDRVKVGWHTIALVQGALAGIAGYVPALSGFQSSIKLLSSHSGVPVSTNFMNGGGLGAGPDDDGVDGICYPTSSTTLPVEIFESSSGGFLVSKELAPDSAGAGRRRGGHGQRVVLGPPEDEASSYTLSLSMSQHGSPPIGFGAGLAGRASRLYVGAEEIPFDQVAARLVSVPHTPESGLVTLDTPGGGGFGDPAERDPQLVLRDVRDGLLSVEAAAEIYGVDVELDTLSAKRRGA
ncbi:hydantoinase B/oxoprolinase family protein [Amycolatopsis rhabdoformis]|uniref:Hydantoinase B/oxoprolinase family protein n=1 Tax=Amycolatopsis rhabdoformis TaxID=1448059 RepID=A0ABZ1ILF0_9PSEU|nr:hydantoinase B/oxoprolinase family protein [Amycolatopsis rhabdoformis]WSE34523.1 hydantoinase B/oxoprolinase family protein [Amycolatopsis rhabdoformis]